MCSAAISAIAEQIVAQSVVWHSHRPGWDVAPASTATLSLADVATVTELSVADAIVTVGAGISLGELQSELNAKGQCLPIVGYADWTLAELVAFNLPHAQAGSHGSWTDWILGMNVVLGDGLVAKCGAKVVKNVAGYDVHKLFTGARGTLGVVVEVTLRTCPVTSFVPVPWSDDFDYIQRARLTDFDALVESVGSAIANQDAETATIWAKSPVNTSRFAHDWVVSGGAIELRPQEVDFMRRAKAEFDPAGRLNPGAMGIF